MKSTKFLGITIFLTLLTMLSASVVGQEKIITTYANGDTYTSQQEPTFPHGGYSSFFVGDSGSGQRCIAYFQFDVSELTENIIEGNFIIYLDTFTGSLDISVFIVQDSWEEGSLTWNDFIATGGNILNEFHVDNTPQEYSVLLQFNAQDYIGNGQNLFSIGLVNNGPFNYNCSGYTRERTPQNIEDSPKIEWRVEQSFYFPWEIVLPIISIIALSLIVSYVVVKKRRGRGIGSKDDVSLRMYEDEPLIGGRYASIKKKSAVASAAAQEKICLFCGFRNRSRTGYCRSCGNPLSG